MNLSKIMWLVGGKGGTDTQVCLDQGPCYSVLYSATMAALMSGYLQTPSHSW